MFSNVAIEKFNDRKYTEARKFSNGRIFSSGDGKFTIEFHARLMYIDNDLRRISREDTSNLLFF